MLISRKSWLHDTFTCLVTLSVLIAILLNNVSSLGEDLEEMDRGGGGVEPVIGPRTSEDKSRRRGKGRRRKQQSAEDKVLKKLSGEQKILANIMQGYDARVRPKGLNKSWDQTGGPVIVKVNMMIRSISKIDDVNMEYSCQVTFREEWVDQRLMFGGKKDSLIKAQQSKKTPEVVPDGKAEKQAFVVLPPKNEIWMPDSFFQNEKQARKHNIDKPNVLIRIYDDGKILYSVRISLVLSCPMDLHNYPMDMQMCLIDLASYAYTEDDIKYVWKKSRPIQIKDEVNSSLPSFELKEIVTTYCTSSTNTGTYSCLRTKIVLARQFSYYLLQLYIPSSMLVIVSWVSFWLDRSAVPARVTLGVTTLLTMTTQSSGINAKLPPVSYTKAIDIWIGVCLAFIFGALLEFACVTYVGDKDAMKRKKKAEGASKNEQKMEKNNAAETSLFISNKRMTVGPNSSPSAHNRLRALSRLDDEDNVMNPLLQQQTTTPSPVYNRNNATLPPQHMMPVSPNLPPHHMLAQNYPHFIAQDGEIYDRSLRIQERRRPVITGFFLFRPFVKLRRTLAKEKDRSKKIDYISRMIFPLGFFSFNIIYWVVYKGMSDTRNIEKYPD